MPNPTMNRIGLMRFAASTIAAGTAGMAVLSCSLLMHSSRGY